ncbi:MAG: MerR family transcriptional regulator [Candidatus Onthomonas sp.]
MQYTIKALANLAGVTPRTLRWYDSIGLLRPGAVTPAGYRLYGPAEVERLQQILFYRELGLPLGEIRAILDDPAFDQQAALQSHLAELNRRKERLTALILTVEKTLCELKGESAMTDQEKFEGFKVEIIQTNEARYGRESREMYGDKAIDRSNVRIMGMTSEQYRRWKELEEMILSRLTQAVRSGEDPAGAEGQAIAALHREWCSFTLGEYNPKLHAGLGELYTSDERFSAYYDREEQGCSQFLRDAILRYIEQF